MNRNDPQNSPILKWPPNTSTISSDPKNIHFLKNPEDIEIQNFETPKMVRAYVNLIEIRS